MARPIIKPQEALCASSVCDLSLSTFCVNLGFYPLAKISQQHIPVGVGLKGIRDALRIPRAILAHEQIPYAKI